jgi:hypothetical protein
LSLLTALIGLAYHPHPSAGAYVQRSKPSYTQGLNVPQGQPPVGTSPLVGGQQQIPYNPNGLNISSLNPNNLGGLDYFPDDPHMIPMPNYPTYERLNRL